MSKKERLITLHDLMLNVPSRVIDMDRWRDGKDGTPSDDDLAKAIKQVKETKLECGTTACALGYACSAPVFQKEGLVWTKDQFDEHYPSFVKGEHTYTAFDAASKFFKISEDSADYLFGSLRQSEEDSGLTHKQLFLRRMRKFLVKKGYIDNVEALRLRYEAAKIDDAEGVDVY